MLRQTPLIWQVSEINRLNLFTKRCSDLAIHGLVR